MLTPHEKVGKVELWDLLSMLKAYAYPFACALAWLADLENELAVNPDQDIGPAVEGHESKLVSHVHYLLNWLDSEARTANLPEVSRHILRLREAWEVNDEHFDAIKLKERLRIIREVTCDALRGRKYFLVSRPEFYESEDLFGAPVAIGFLKAKEDIAEAGKCLALGRATATVFHCMRVVEVGLQALAVHLNVKLKNDRPLEYEDWQHILTAIDKKIMDLRAAKTAENQESIQFYSEVAAQFRYFRDAWRNHVSHARETYDLLQSESIFGQVREFMQDLAKRIKV